MNSKSWSQGLLHTIRDPNFLVISNDQIVVIKDKFPKAKYHFLVLPLDNIANIFSLTKQHINLIEEMDLLAHNVIEISGRKLDEFKIGYHAAPSMHRLHLHVISRDFQSVCMKTKKHWNSFNTPFFLSSKDIIKQLNQFGKVTKMSEHLLKELLSADLKCHICEAKLKKMPNLKEHLLTHNIFLC